MPALTESAERAKNDAIAKAKAARAAFNTLRTEAAASGVDLGPGSDTFAKLDEAHTALCEADEAASIAEQHYIKAVQMDGGSIPTYAAEYQSAPTPKQRAAAGSEAILKGDSYGSLRSTLKQSGKMGVGGVKPLGEAFSRDQFRNALITGGSSTSGGAFIENDRQAYVDVPGRPTSLLNWITVGTTDSDTVEYVRLNAAPSSAAFTAEATTVASGSEDGLKPEGTATFAVKTAVVETIAELLPITRNAFADAGQLRTILDKLLGNDLNRGVESGVVNGGASANFQGITETTGINAVAYDSAHNIAELLRMGITQIRLDFEEPDYIAMHPADAERLAFLRTGVYNGTTTAQLGDYILGGPAVGRIPTLWGLPIVESVLVTEGMPFIGTKDAATLWVREGAHVLVSDSHKDWFQRNVLALLAEARVAFGVQRPNAFCTVDIAA